MLDKFKRKITYIRISVTDRCNLRCIYCMPEEGIKLISHNEILTYDEIYEICQVGAELGINKVRLTGGEPLVRKGIELLVEKIASIPQITDLNMTTNGIFLEHYAQILKDAGLMRVNVSLDTLDPDEYKRITRGGDIYKVFKGIEAAVKVGLTPVKLNAVVMDKNDKKTKLSLIEYAKNIGVEIRFISQMHLDKGDFQVVEGGDGGNCKICNRLRLTANGFIKPCLFSDDEYSVRELGIREAILKAVEFKPKSGTTCTHRNFYNIGG